MRSPFLGTSDDVFTDAAAYLAVLVAVADSRCGAYNAGIECISHNKQLKSRTVS